MEKNTFRVVKKKRVERSDFNVECNIAVDGEVGKIFSVCHSACVENVEVTEGAVNITGNIDLCIVYESVNGEVLSTNQACAFSSKIESDQISAGDKVCVFVDIVECTIDNVSGQNIKLSLVLGQRATVISCYDVPSVDASGENICAKRENISVSTYVGEASEVFAVESEASIKEPIRKVILCDSAVSVKNTECKADYVVVTGEVVERILYLTENDRYETIYLTENFKEEVELAGVTSNATLEAYLDVKRQEVKCEVVNEEKGVKILITAPIALRVCAFKEEEVSVVKDLYSCKERLDVTTESFDMTKELNADHFEAKFDGVLSLDENAPRIDKLLFVAGANLFVSNSYIQNGEVFVEGVAKANVVYLNDEENSLHSVTMEVPFVVSDRARDEVEDAKIFVDAVLYDVDVIAKKGRDLFFDGKLKVSVYYDIDEVCAVITNASQTGEVFERDCDMELVFAKAGEDAWDIAKKFSVQEETLLLQNPDVIFPLSDDANLILYYQKLK